jgi:alpha-beta hydrolase superfamily lysophospholipase
VKDFRNMKKILIYVMLVLSSTTFAINPERVYKTTPDKAGLKYTEYQIKTIDNFTLNVWEYILPNAAKSNRTIILVGPDAGNMSYLIWQAKAFAAKGIRVITFDYRGFGKSSDFTINKDFLFYTEFGLDLDAVIKATREKYSKDKIGLHSMSMGTYVSLLSKEKIDFSIAEGFFHDPQKIVDRIKFSKGKIILLPKEAKSIIKLNQKIPLLIFCANKDKTTTTQDAQEFAKSNKVKIIEFDGEHLTGMYHFKKSELGDEYTDKIIEFLNENGV